MKRQDLENFIRTQEVPQKQVKMFADKIEATNPVIYQEFEMYISQRTMPTLCIEGFTCEMLIKRLGLSIIGALLTLDWLMREPKEAKQAIEDGIK